MRIDTPLRTRLPGHDVMTLTSRGTFFPKHSWHCSCGDTGTGTTASVAAWNAGLHIGMRLGQAFEVTKSQAGQGK